MRILLVHDYGALIGGAEHMTLALREGLRSRGHDARIFASDATRPGLESVADVSCHGSESLTRRITQVMNPLAAMALNRVLSEWRPDVVHVRSFLTQLSPLILPQLRAVPSLLHVVDYQLICPLQSKLLPDGTRCESRAGMVCNTVGCVSLAGVARVKAQRAMWDRWNGAIDLVIANSESTARRLREDGIRVDRAIWNGVPPAPARPALTDPPSIAFAGRLSSEKGVDILLRAMQQVIASVPRARLLIAGDGPDRPMLERLAADLGVSAAVVFLGRVPRQELDAALASAWVQAVPSVWEEPFGLAAAEAMMRGTAVVATNTGGLSEIVRAGAGGVSVPPGDVAQLAIALTRLCNDRALSEKMGADARMFALAELSEARCLDRFSDLYSELTSSGRAARS